MPIRRTGLDDHLKLADAFAWAADHGADVISCSFGLDGQPFVLPDVVRSAFDYVTTRGRGGKGPVGAQTTGSRSTSSSARPSSSSPSSRPFHDSEYGEIDHDEGRKHNLDPAFIVEGK
jgi:hypothetical protein